MRQDSKLSTIQSWDKARRSYIIFTGPFKRAWAVKYVIDKIKSIIKDSEACFSCKCEFPVDAMHRDIFFLHVTIDGKKKQDVEACDSRIFSEIFRELESMGLQHNISQLSFPEGYLRIAYINVAELKEDVLRKSPHGMKKTA